MERLDYKAKKQIGEIVTQCDGVIFGGFVRDMILHSHMCDRFYSAHKEGFADPMVDPATADRLIVPRDIDCHFKTEGEYNHFVAELKHYGFQTTKRINRTMYLPDSEGAKHIKLMARVPCTERDLKRILTDSLPLSVSRNVVDLLNFGNIVQPPTIHIDVIIHETKSPPFSELDFRCNGLVMSKQGIHLCDLLGGIMLPFGKFKLMQDIVEDIHNKVARVYQTKPERYIKMVAKGWTVYGDTISRVVEPCEYCILCHEVCTKTDHYKLNCCAAGYHRACLSRAIHEFMEPRNECMHCKQSCYFTDLAVLI